MIPSWAIYAAIGALSVTVVGFAYYEGKRVERVETEAANLQATFDQLLERRKTDEKVFNFTPAELCAAIGGELRNNECE